MVLQNWTWASSLATQLTHTCLLMALLLIIQNQSPSSLSNPEEEDQPDVNVTGPELPSTRPFTIPKNLFQMKSPPPQSPSPSTTKTPASPAPGAAPTKPTSTPVRYIDMNVNNVKKMMFPAVMSCSCQAQLHLENQNSREEKNNCGQSSSNSLVM